jgi:hypothetical protein
MKKASLLIAAAALISMHAPAFAQQQRSPRVQETFVQFESCFDLESSTVADDDFDCLPEGDIRFAFHGDRTTPTVMFWNELVANLVLLPSVPFSAVNASLLVHQIRFAEHLNEFPGFDVPFTPIDTALVLTGEGNIFKVGFAICMTTQPDRYPGCTALEPGGEASQGVQFQYARLQ